MKQAALEKNVFTDCAVHYHHRAPYSDRVVRCLKGYVGGEQSGFKVAELAAGTGLLTRTLAKGGLTGYAVEPNLGMRTEAATQGNGRGNFVWSAGSVEDTGLPESSVNWICISNAFHLVDIPRALQEAQRILRPNGYLTAIWMLDKPAPGTFQQTVEAIIRDRAPELRALHPPVEDLMAQLAQAPGFKDCIYVESEDSESMDAERYLGIWKSSHLVPSTMSRSQWEPILTEIETRAKREPSLHTLWRTRAWTVQKSS